MPYTKKLRMYRAETDETQEVFAKLLECSTANYSLKEQGKVPFSLEEAKKVTDHINTQLGKTLSIEEIFFTI